MQWELTKALNGLKENQMNKLELLQIVGANIAKLRTERDYTQRQLGALAGFNPSHLSKIEHGERDINTTSLIRIAKALGIKMDELFRGTM